MCRLNDHPCDPVLLHTLQCLTDIIILFMFCPFQFVQDHLTCKCPVYRIPGKCFCNLLSHYLYCFCHRIQMTGSEAYHKNSFFLHFQSFLSRNFYPINCSSSFHVLGAFPVASIILCAFKRSNNRKRAGSSRFVSFSFSVSLHTASGAP